LLIAEERLLRPLYFGFSGCLLWVNQKLPQLGQKQSVALPAKKRH